MTDEEIEKIVSKDFRYQSIVLWAIAIAGMLILNTIILINVNDLKNEMDDIEDWQSTVDEQINILSKTTDMIYQMLYEEDEECEGIYMDENDKIELDFNKTTGTLSFVYYDNHFEQLKGSPTFTPENWTDLGDWILDQHHDTFTQMQVNVLSYIIANMAYYKETGTWLGE
jgi:hypothetical protein